MATFCLKDCKKPIPAESSPHMNGESVLDDHASSRLRQSILCMINWPH